MNPAFKLFLILFTLLVTAAQVAAEEWQGIVPLRSTRADVVHRFGPLTFGDLTLSRTRL